MSDHLPDSVTVEIAFSTNPLATPTWTDVTAYVRGLSINRGRQHELDRMETGTATVVLDNSDRRFEPEYASGAYHPNVKPMRRLRITATDSEFYDSGIYDAGTYEPVTYDLFEGFIERWPLQYPGKGKDATVTVTAVDAFAFFSILRFPSYPEVVEGDSPTAYYRLGDGPSSYTDTTGTHAAGTGTDTTHSATGLLPAGSGDDGAAGFNGSSSKIDLPSTARISGSGSFSIEAIVNTTATGSQDYIFGQMAASVRVWVNMESSGTVRLRTEGNHELISTGTINDGENHHIVAVRDAAAGTFSIWIDGVEDATASKTIAAITNDGAVQIGAQGNSTAQWDGTIDEFAIYSGVLSDADILQHAKAAGLYAYGSQASGTRIGEVLDLIGWPAGERDLDAGARNVQDFSLPTQTPREHIEEVVAAEQGLFFVAADGDMTFIDRTALAAMTSEGTWGDTTGEHPYEDIVISYDVDRIRNDVRVQINGGGTHVATDATSITTYGRRTHSVTTQHATVADAVADAATLLADFKDPAVRIEQLTINPARDAKWAQVFGLELGDKITVRRRPPGGGSALEQTVRVGAITHEAAPDTGWTTTLQLEQI